MSIDFVVGNTYQRLSKQKANRDRSGEYLKVHDWTLYVDILNGDPDLVDRVSFDLPTFDPQIFHATYPVPVTRPNGRQAWRFATRQQSYGSITATIKIRGAGGSIQELTHDIVLEESRKKQQLQTFEEPRHPRPARMIKLPDYQKYAEDLSNGIPRNVEVIDAYRDGRATSNNWKLVPDSSIVCNTTMPNCNTFELVSPVLEGGPGLDEVSRVLREMNRIRPKLKVNKSMGFHVHIDVSALSLKQLIKICQNFIKYEDVFDSFMPQSRRNGSPECERFFKSNRRSVPGHTNKQRHYALANCADTATLVGLMNREGRYYKLNMQNLVSGRQPTIEFRQHSSTMNYQKVSAWVRFCSTFVNNSARFATPSPFLPTRTLDQQFDGLFQYVIKDRALRDFYKDRQLHLDDDEDCCIDCQYGRSCRGK